MTKKAEVLQLFLFRLENWSGTRFWCLEWGLAILRNFLMGKITLRSQFSEKLKYFSYFWSGLKIDGNVALTLLIMKIRF